MTSHIDDTAEKIAIHEFNHRYFQQRASSCMGYLPYELIPQIIEEGFSQFLLPMLWLCLFLSEGLATLFSQELAELANSHA